MSEFEKWYKNSGNAWSFSTDSTNKSKFKVAWKAALRMIKYEGVISDYELASKIIKDELEE